MSLDKENLPNYENYDENNANSTDPMGTLSSKYASRRISVTYENPDKEKRKEKPTITQNYLDMNDILVPVLVKKGDDGQIYFAMEYTYIPARKQIYLELPSIGMKEQKESYTKEDILNSTINLTNMLQLYTSNNEIKDLTSGFDPVSQSFTNQTAKLVELGVKDIKGDKRLQWFPVSNLEDILSRDIPMSIQTKYALLRFSEKHKNEIAKYKSTEAEIDEELLTNPRAYGHRDNDIVIWPHKYRFGVAKEEIPGPIQDLMGTGRIDYAAENIEYDNDGTAKETSIYGMSKNSVQVVLTRVKNGKLQVGLSPQHRSPFISKQNIKEVFTETVAGMIENKHYENIDITSDEYKNLDLATKEILYHYAALKAAKDEAQEEAGVEISSDWLKPISQHLLLSHGTEELSEFYLAKLPENYIQGNKKLDEEETIGDIQWYDFDSLDIDSLHAPMPTKIALLMARNYIQKEKEQETQLEDTER